MAHKGLHANERSFNSKTGGHELTARPLHNLDQNKKRLELDFHDLPVAQLYKVRTKLYFLQFVLHKFKYLYYELSVSNKLGFSLCRLPRPELDVEELHPQASMRASTPVSLDFTWGSPAQVVWWIMMILSCVVGYLFVHGY